MLDGIGPPCPAAVAIFYPPISSSFSSATRFVFLSVRPSMALKVDHQCIRQLNCRAIIGLIYLCVRVHAILVTRRSNKEFYLLATPTSCVLSTTLSR